MTQVKILVKGYVSSDTKIVCSTITLIQDKDINMVVDPGTLKDRQILIDALKKEKLSIEDINFVCITHSHMDHYRNIGMFPNAKVLDYWGVWDKDTMQDWNEKNLLLHNKSDKVEFPYVYKALYLSNNKKISKNIEIIKTPGHNYDCITLLVKTEKGIVAVAGDVFWKENFPDHDIYASDIETLKKSRQLVLEKADFIIPGHGDIYKVKKNGKIENA